MRIGRRPAWLYPALVLVSGGTLAWSWHKFGREPKPGVQQNNLWLRASTGRGAVAWVTGLVLTGFYVVLYWYSSDNGQGNFGSLNNLVHGLDPFSQGSARPARRPVVSLRHLLHAGHAAHGRTGAVEIPPLAATSSFAPAR